MGVQLNIKDPETVRLARELAGRTGRSVTETIRAALERIQMEERQMLEERVDTFMEDLRRIPCNRPTQPTDARAIMKAFHEQEWQEQYGVDQWS